MKTRHAAPFLALLFVGTTFGALSFGGCSSSSDATTPPPAYTNPVDTGIAETKPIDTGSPDTKPPADTKPPTCDQDLPTDFKCVAPKTTVGSTACTETMLQDFATACVAADLKVPSTCAAWKTANAACTTCIEAWAFDPSIIPGKVIPDRDKCYYAVFDDKCDLAVNCYFECGDAVCNACDNTVGTGTKPTTSE